MEWKIAYLLAALIASATGYPLFSTSGSARVPTGDDNNVYQRIGQTFRFFGRSYSTIRIYTNGYVSLGSGNTGGYTPRPFPFRGAPMIAPYWADVDTRGTGSVFYKSSTSSADLNRAAGLISSTYRTSFHPNRVYVVTWYRVGAYYRSRSPLNTFQVVLATNGQQSYVMFLYQSVTWTYGRASGGRHARAGLNAGDGRRQITVPYSGSSAISSIEGRSNVGINGLYIYSTTGPTVPSGPPPSILFPISGHSVLPIGDDLYRVRTVNQPIKMYGRSYRTVYVSNNGYISLNGYTGGYTPRPFPYRSVRPIIAPYWADVDTRSGSGRVYHGETTSSSLRSRAAGLVRRIYKVSFYPTHLFIATWKRVGYYNRHTDKLNSFQVVVASNSAQSFIIFLYDQLQWTTGDASGGRRTGFGGTYARAGINGGYGVNAITLYGSGSRAILAKTRDTNCGQTGIFVLAPSRTGTLYQYTGRALPRSDDGSATVRFSMPFYRRMESVMQIYNNGYLTLRGPGGSYTPRPFARGSPMIAPYWADVDTRTGPGRVYYGVTSSTNLLKRAKYEVEATYRTPFNPTRLFIATYNNVGFYNRHTNLRNTYQAVIATDGRSTYVMFIYQDIRWTTGDASGGRGGLGGHVARAGINSGVGRYLYIPGSGNQNLMLSLETRTNVRMPGIFILRGNPARTDVELQDSTVVDEEYTEDQSINKQEYEANMEGNEDTDDDNAVDMLTQELENLDVTEDEEGIVEEEKAELEEDEVKTEEEGMQEDGMEDEEVVDEEYQEVEEEEKLALIEDEGEEAEEEGGGGKVQGGGGEVQGGGGEVQGGGSEVQGGGGEVQGGGGEVLGDGGEEEEMKVEEVEGEKVEFEEVEKVELEEDEKVEVEEQDAKMEG